MKRMGHSATLFLLAAFLLYRGATGGLSAYIHPRFLGLVVAGGVASLVLAAAAARPGRGGRASWFGMAMVGGAAIAGLAVTPRPLGSAAVEKRGIDQPAVRAIPASIPAPSPVAATAAPGPTITNVYEGFNYLHENEGRDDRIEGTRVDIVGFVHREHDFVGDYVTVARFTITCCAADASPMGLLVRWPSAAGLEKDRWIHVCGHLTTGTLEYEPQKYMLTPYVQAESIEPMAAPAQPYIDLRR